MLRIRLGWGVKPGTSPHLSVHGVSEGSPNRDRGGGSMFHSNRKVFVFPQPTSCCRIFHIMTTPH